MSPYSRASIPHSDPPSHTHPHLCLSHTDSHTTQLVELGYTKAAASDQASVVVLNTCSIRDHAEQKVYPHFYTLLALLSLSVLPPQPLSPISSTCVLLLFSFILVSRILLICRS